MTGSSSKNAKPSIAQKGPALNPTAPISGPWLRCLLEQLNEEPGGGGRFEQLAVALVHRRKAPNIKPATPPSSGGDLGVDARTTKTLIDQEPLFRLYETPPEVDERWIFAFSIEKKWKPKLESDLMTIRANRLAPSRVVFVTTCRIHPERVKIETERALAKQFKVEVEILDGSWIERHLLSTDYHLAVLHLGAPPAADPELEAFAQKIAGLSAAGMTDDEAEEVARLEKNLQYFNRSTERSEHFFRDVKSLAGILARYDSTYARALEWYRLAWARAIAAPAGPAVMEVAYAYLRALVRDPTLHTEMLNGVEQYITMVFATNVPYHARGAANLLLHLTATRHKEPRWVEACSRLREWCRQAPGRAYGIASQGHAADAALLIDSLDAARARDEQGRASHFQALAAHLSTYRNVIGVPLEHWAESLAAASAVCAGEESFETTYEIASAIVRERKGDLALAVVSRDRAVALARNKRFAEAVRFAAKAQSAWFSPNYQRGFVLMGLFIANCFQSLERPWAARAALLQTWHVATNDPRHRDLDLVHQIFLGLYNCAASAGWWRECFHLLRYYYGACAMARVEPVIEMATFVQGAVPVLLNGLSRVSPAVHDVLLYEARKIFPSAALTYEEITLATDDAFERWLDDPELSLPQRDELRALRSKTRDGPFAFTPPPVDESAAVRVLKAAWPHALGTSTLSITAPNDEHALGVAVDIAAQFEAWLTLGSEHRLCVIDDEIHIEIVYGTIGGRGFKYEQRSDGSFQVVVSREKLANAYANLRTDTFNDALGIVCGAVIGAALDDPKPIFAAFAPQRFVEVRGAIAAAAPPSYIMTHSLKLRSSHDTG